MRTMSSATAAPLPAGLRARAGDPCPDGCTTGYGREKRPVLVERAVDSPGMRAGLPPGEHQDDDGERWCPDCWGYMGNEISPDPKAVTS